MKTHRQKRYSSLVSALVALGFSSTANSQLTGSCLGLVSIPKDTWAIAIDEKGYLAMLSINFSSKLMRAYTTIASNQTSPNNSPIEPIFTTTGPFSTSFTLEADLVEGMYRIKPSSHFPELLVAPVNSGTAYLLMEVNGPGRGTCSTQ
jgi:hypothetical protein